MEKLVGFLYNNVEYIYERNVQGDILGIYKKDDLTRVAEYVYDAYGNHKVINYTVNNIGDINPIRYRGYYFDTETKLYYLNSRYYSAEFGRFISPDTLSILDETQAQINGLNLYMYCADNPVMNVDPNGMNWWNWLISGIQLVAGIVLCATGVGAGFGASLIVGGVMGIAMQFVSPAISQIVGGISSVASGGAAISTGISLCAFGPWGIAAGIALMVVGAGTMAFGANEVVAGATGTNYIQQWTGWSNELYNGLYIGLNIASAICSIAGNIGMKYASNRILNNIIKNPSTIQDYSLRQIKTYGKYNTQFSVEL